jgi:hypothetical protein
MPDTTSRLGRAAQLRRWASWTLVLVGLVAAAAASTWLFFALKEQSGQPGGAAPFLAIGGFVAAVAQVLLAWLQLRQDSRRTTAEHLSPHERRERGAHDKLRHHLGRQGQLRRMDDPATSALALRVRRAIDLPQPSGWAATDDTGAGIHVTGWRRLLPRPWRGHRGGTSALDPDLPIFVDRDQGPAIRNWLQAARDRGGFLLLVGDPAVGKTRLLYEAARAVLPDFAVLAPDRGDGDLVNRLAHATFSLPKLIVWLDELHRYLDGPYLTPGSAPITPATIRRLLDAPTPIVIVGTLWRQHAIELRAPANHAADGGQFRYPDAADILNEQRCKELTLHTFSVSERRAAHELVWKDPRLAEALADRHFSVTEVLAGAPQLMRRYEHAAPDQQAVLNAAIDAHRVWVHTPLTEPLLAAAARGYLTRVHPDDSWLTPILAELAQPEGPTAPLIEIHDATRHTTLGYTVSDYLLRHATTDRRSHRLPAVTWQALIDHTYAAGDQAGLAVSAERRLLYCYAERLYRRLAVAGDTYAARRLAGLLVRQGRIGEATAVLHRLINAGETYERDGLARHNRYRWMIRWLAEHGQSEAAITVLRAWAEAGDRDAADEWPELAIAQDRIDQAAPLARTLLDFNEEHHLAGWFDRLIDHDRIDEAMTVLQALIDVGATHRVDLLAYKQPRTYRVTPRPGSQASLFHGTTEYVVKGWFDRLVERGRAEEAMTMLRALADAGNRKSREALADLLAEHGAVEELSVRADADHDAERDPYGPFDRRLADLLVEQGNIRDLRVRADAGSWPAAVRLAEVLVAQGDLEQLRSRADTGDEAAGKRLARLLSEQGISEALRSRADAGDRYAAERLTKLLARQDRIDEAVTIARTLASGGDWTSGNLLDGLLRRQGNAHELRARADAGDQYAAELWAEMLVDQDRVDEAAAVVRALVDAGRAGLVDRWSNRLVEQGRVEDAMTVLGALAAAGDYFGAALQLATLLVSHDRAEDAAAALRAWRGVAPSTAAPWSRGLTRCSSGRMTRSGP